MRLTAPRAIRDAVATILGGWEREDEVESSIRDSAGGGVLWQSSGRADPEPPPPIDEPVVVDEDPHGYDVDWVVARPTAAPEVPGLHLTNRSEAPAEITVRGSIPLNGDRYPWDEPD